MGTGIKIGDLDSGIGERNIQCIDCLKSTQHLTITRYPFAKVNRPLNWVSVEIGGPMKFADCTGNYKYILMFVNHSARHTWVFLIISRKMALSVLQIWKASAENACRSKLLMLQTVNAGEFMAKKCTQVCQDVEMTNFTTATNGRHMNSYAERVIRTILEHASTML